MSAGAQTPANPPAATAPAANQPAATQPTAPVGSAPAATAGAGSPASTVAAAGTQAGSAGATDAGTPIDGAVVRPGTGSALLPHDLSPWGMFLHADVVVKAVMIGLAFASLLTWTILIAKAIELLTAQRTARAALSHVATAQTLRDAAEKVTGETAGQRLIDAALNEADRSRGLPADGTKERAVALLSRIEARAGRTMARGTGLLATIGSTAPFVGLFGTVWGIMNSFIGISKTNTTNLAVVAPGIAEALLATATGLIAAIPAVIIFNAFARGITGYRQLLGDVSTEVLRLMSRELDRDSQRGIVGRHAAE